MARLPRWCWLLLLAYTLIHLAVAAVLVVTILAWHDQAVQLAERQQLGRAAALAEQALRPYLDQQEELQTRLRQLAERSRLELVVLDGDGRTIARSNQQVGPTLDRSEAASTVEPWDERRPFAAVPIQAGGAPWVLMARSPREEPASDSRLHRLLWAVGLLSVLPGVALCYVAVRRQLRSLGHVTRQAQAFAEGTGGEPLVQVDAGSEYVPLLEQLVRMQHRHQLRVEELRENSQRLSTVLGNMIEGVIAVDPAERVLLANEASRRLLGFPTKSPVGRPLLEATRDRHVHEAVVEALRSEMPVEREFESSGRVRRVLSLRATRLPGEPCPGVLVVLHDVSELRRLENLRRELVANVSHELKTPLASIKAYAETLRLGAIDDAEHNLEFVRRIEDQAERLHQLILDLIQLARVESGEEVLEIAEIPVAAVVQDLVEQFQDLAQTKPIRLATEPPEDSLTVRADEEGLRTILSNLVDNAIKYTPAGGQVNVRWFAEGNWAVLEVRDTGIGIAEADQGRVFERFYRVDRARSRELGGTGLGLAIVKHLAQAMGGSVVLESRLRQGSTFRVRLPRS